MSEGNPNIRVEITDPSEFHCFRIVLDAAVEVGGERQPLEIMFHARQLVDLIHKCSTALCEWQAQTSAQLLAQIAHVRVFGGGIVGVVGGEIVMPEGGEREG